MTSTNIKNNQNVQANTQKQDISQQPQYPKLPIPDDKRQSDQPKPLKAVLGQPKKPKQPKVIWGKRFFRWRSGFCRWLGRALVLALLFRFMFELVPSLKEELPQLYQVYRWVAQVAEKLFEFVYGLFGSIFRGEFGTFFPKVWEGIKELFNGFIQLF